eukprot:765783-Hanusia_phi.AAC.2
MDLHDPQGNERRAPPAAVRAVHSDGALLLAQVPEVLDDFDGGDVLVLEWKVEVPNAVELELAGLVLELVPQRHHGRHAEALEQVAVVAHDKRLVVFVGGL